MCPDDVYFTLESAQKSFVKAQLDIIFHFLVVECDSVKDTIKYGVCSTDTLWDMWILFSYLLHSPSLLPPLYLSPPHPPSLALPPSPNPHLPPSPNPHPSSPPPPPPPLPPSDQFPPHLRIIQWRCQVLEDWHRQCQILQRHPGNNR